VEKSLRAFKGDTRRSCTSYYTSVRSTSFRIRHVLQDGPTAAVEAQDLGAGRKLGYFTMLLSHIRGWQAVDVVPGGPVRALMPALEHRAPHSNDPDLRSRRRLSDMAVVLSSARG
jgi:hypothetical protein